MRERIEERIERERATELAILDWVVPCAKSRRQLGTCFSRKILRLPRVWNQPSIQRVRNARLSRSKMFHTCACLGVKDPRSRRALKRAVRYLTNSRELLKFVVRKCPNKHVHGPVNGPTNAYRSFSRWHTRARMGTSSDSLSRE